MDSILSGKGIQVDTGNFVICWSSLKLGKQCRVGAWTPDSWALMVTETVRVDGTIQLIGINRKDMRTWVPPIDGQRGEARKGEEEGNSCVSMSRKRRVTGRKEYPSLSKAPGELNKMNDEDWPLNRRLTIEILQKIICGKWFGESKARVSGLGWDWEEKWKQEM